MIILYIYFIIAGISALGTAAWLIEGEIDEIDSFWDWVIYNLFWIIHPIKAAIKFFKNVVK